MSSPLAVIVDRSDLDLAPAASVLRTAGFDVLEFRYDLDPRVPDAARQADVAIVGFTHLDESFFAQLPRLCAVATCSTGTDMIDTAAAAAAGVAVLPLGDVATEEVATHALTLALAAERDLLGSAAIVAAGGWTAEVTAVPRRLSTLTAGVFGFGRIGRRFADIVKPLVGRVIAYDPLAPIDADGVTAVDFDDLVSSSDILSLHAPLVPSTRHRFNEAAFASVRSGFVLINTSRAELIDPDALRDALDDGRVAWAALDVLVGEPPATNDRLLAHPHTLITPHIAFLSAASLEAYRTRPGENLSVWWKENIHDESRI